MTGHVRKAGELPYLDEEESTCQISCSQSSGAVEKMKTDQFLLFHYRFGHHSFVLLKRWFTFVFGNVDVKTLFCEACQLA